MRAGRWLRRRAQSARPAPALDARVAYDRVAPVYPPEAHNPLMAMEEAAVIGLLPAIGGRHVLDAGCGSGRYLRRLAAGEAGGAPRRLVGCDVSPAMLGRAAAETASAPAMSARASGRTASTPRRPLFVRADVLALPFVEGVFDVVVCGLVVGHVADLRSALGEIARVLATGGVAVWSDVHPAGTLLGWRRDFRDEGGRQVVVRQHLHLFSDHLAACRAAGLEIEDAREPRIDFDHPQRGWPAVLALRARRRA